MTPPLALSLTLTPRKAARVLFPIIAVLGVLSSIAQFIRYSGPDHTNKWYIAFFDVNREQNLPTFFQGVHLLVCAGILAIIALSKWHNRDRFRLAWASLAGLAVLLSFDELCMLHEQLHRVATAMGLQPKGMLRLTWVVPGAILVATVGIVYLKFLLHLPRAARNGLILAAAVFVGGAIGMEMLGSWYVEHYGEYNIPCQLIASAEEVMEMSGVATAIITLLGYASQSVAPVSVRFEPQSRPATASYELPDDEFSFNDLPGKPMSGPPMWLNGSSTATLTSLNAELTRV